MNDKRDASHLKGNVCFRQFSPGIVIRHKSEIRLYQKRKIYINVNRTTIKVLVLQALKNQHLRFQVFVKIFNSSRSIPLCLCHSNLPLVDNLHKVLKTIMHHKIIRSKNARHHIISQSRIKNVRRAMILEKIMTKQQ